MTSPGNTIFLKSPTDNSTLRLTPELVDFEKRVLVRVNDRQVFNNFVKPDTAHCWKNFDLEATANVCRWPF